MSCKITVLLENTAPEGLEAEHGLSLFVETPETTFIFDCGQTGMAWRNAERLGIRELDLCHCSGNAVPRTISTGSVIKLA